MYKYKAGDVVRIVLEPSELNKKHFLTRCPQDIPLKLGQTYKILDVHQWEDQNWYHRLTYIDEYGKQRVWNVLESAIAPLYTVEEELD